MTVTRDDPIVLVVTSCDRCGTRAKIRAELQSGGQLLLCAHHGRQHGEALWRQGAVFTCDSDTPSDIRAAYGKPNAPTP